MENIDDFVMLTEPYSIPFNLRYGVSITGVLFNFTFFYKT